MKYSFRNLFWDRNEYPPSSHLVLKLKKALKKFKMSRHNSMSAIKKVLYMRSYLGTFQWRTVVKMLLCLFIYLFVFFRLYKSVIVKSLFLFLKHPFFNTYQETTTEKARTRAGPSLIICLACSLQLL